MTEVDQKIKDTDMFVEACLLPNIFFEAALNDNLRLTMGGCLISS